MQRKLILLVVLLAAVSTIYCEKLIMTVAFCPDGYSVKGALVEVDTTGGLSVVQMFNWPQQIASEGCISQLRPTFAFNYQKSELLLDFVELFGEFVTVSLIDGSTTYVAPTNPFFDGFYNMVYVSQNKVRGLSGKVTSSPIWCGNGCFELAELDLVSGHIREIGLLPFKSIMEDTHFYDPKTNTLWIQAASDLRPKNETCAPSRKDVCLLNIDANTGALRSAKYTPDWTAYRYAAVNGNSKNVQAFLQGTEKTCNTGANNEMFFGSVNLNTATATVSTCVARNVVISEAPWCSSFSLDGSILATASGNTLGNSQLVILNTASGKAIVNANINSLATTLGANNGFSIWGLNFIAS